MRDLLLAITEYLAADDLYEKHRTEQAALFAQAAPAEAESSRDPAKVE